MWNVKRTTKKRRRYCEKRTWWRLSQWVPNLHTIQWHVVMGNVVPSLRRMIRWRYASWTRFSINHCFVPLIKKFIHISTNLYNITSLFFFYFSFNWHSSLLRYITQNILKSHCRLLYDRPRRWSTLKVPYCTSKINNVLFTETNNYTLNISSL